MGVNQYPDRSRGAKRQQDDKRLMLYNDDVNSFDHVTTSLMTVCEHDAVQAEQCAYLAHHKGRTDVKTGSASQLERMQKKLLQRGLNAVIE